MANFQDIAKDSTPTCLAGDTGCQLGLQPELVAGPAIRGLAMQLGLLRGMPGF